MDMNTKNDLIFLYKVLSASTKLGNAKFKYGILKNLNAIDNDIESLKAIEKDIEETLKEFNDKKNEIIIKHGTTGENGNSYVAVDSPDYQLVTEIIKDLTTEYKEDLDKYQEKRLEYETLLSEETTFDFKVHEIAIDNVPDDFEDLAILMKFNIVV